MTSNEVKDSIKEWTVWAGQSGVQRYDIALLKIWIKFERFLSDLFVLYSLGESSEKGYTPKLNIQFQSEEQFNAFMKDGNKKYIEYLDRIDKLSKHIFEDNPFEILYTDSKYKPVMDELKALRNYIAHESVESKRKTINTCFSGNDKKFLEPNEYLKSKEQTSKESYYTFYTNAIAEMVDLLISQPIT